MNWKTSFLFSILGVLAALVPAPARADSDCEGCKDHPQIQRFPGFHLSEVKVNDFNSVEFTLPKDKLITKEGKYWFLGYQQDDAAKEPSCVEVLRNYENAFKKGGGKLEWKRDDSCIGTLSMPLGKSQRWMKLHSYIGGRSTIELEVIEVAAMEQKVEVSASEMLDALTKDGFVALHGILFDTGRDTIKPESEPLLAEVVKLLTDNGSLKLSVEGHTDNQGNAKVNQTLSQKRADSVTKYLLGKGIDAKRLTAIGWGDTKPVADNRTEDGRAQNRRVELVKK